MRARQVLQKLKSKNAASIDANAILKAELSVKRIID